MKRNLLFALFAVLMGIGVMKAENINIDVDNAANVEVSVNNGDIIIPLQDGMNRIADYTAANNPLTIRAAEGAEIISVTKNMSDVLSPNGGGFYTLGIENMMLQIVTSGGEVGEKMYNTWFQLDGKEGSATINIDGEYVDFSNVGDAQGYRQISSAVEAIVAPAEGFDILSVNPGDRNTATANGDGTWTVTATGDYGYVTVTTKAKPIPGDAFTVKTNYLPNLGLVAVKYTNTGEEYQAVPIEADGSAVFPEGFERLAFNGVDNATVTALKRNGEDVKYSDWVGWSSYVEEGDVFEVTTQGPAMEVTVYAANNVGGAGLEKFHVISEGQFFDLKGEEQTITLHRGADVTVMGKGLNTVTTVQSGNIYLIQAPFTFNIGTNNLITINGESADGVKINVTDASAIVAKQLNGRGDQLNLQNGDNSFAVADIKNSLSIVPAEGCEIRSILVNQQPLALAGTGDYVVAVEDGMLIEINARHIPTSVPVTVLVGDANNNNAPSAYLAERLKVTYTVGDKTETLEFTDNQAFAMVPYQALVTISTDAFGFVIDSVDAGLNLVQGENNNYRFYASEACNVNVNMHEIVAPEGYALVQVSSKGGTWGASFLPYDENMQRIEGSINASAPGIVKIGGYVEVTKFSFTYYFKSITVNGEPLKDKDGNVIDFEKEPRDADQSYFVKIEGDCTIAAELFDPMADYIGLTCWNCNDLTYPICIAPLYILDGDKFVDHYNALPGTKVTFVVPYVAAGHNLISLNQVGGNNTFAITDFIASDNGYYMFDYTLPEEVEDGNMFLFQPVCQIDPANQPYVVEFYPTYVEELGVQEVIGYAVAIDQNENRETTTLFATEGEDVEFLIYSRDDYQLVGAIATHGTTDGSGSVYEREIPLTSNANKDAWIYTVNDDDAFEFYGFPKINIQGVFTLISTSLTDVATAGELSYANGVLTGIGHINVFNTAGMLVANGTDNLSVAHLASGLYVAVCGNQTLKFVIK
ncbi:MAG: hypothetical protein K2K69_00390 [Muribaculaceae bacterium]|nr:hypothetical protein [Muribaculaceae bacterium]